MHSEFKIKMKHILFITLLIFVTGCEWWQDKTPNTTTPKIEKEDMVDEDEINDQDSLELVKENWITFFETKKDHTLVEINKIEIDFGSNCSIEEKECLETLNTKQEELNRRIEEFKKAPKQSYDEMKNGIDSAIADLERFVEQVRLPEK
jgi:hypothetical protein